MLRIKVNFLLIIKIPDYAIGTKRHNRKYLKKK